MNFRQFVRIHSDKHSTGQSLVETALMLPLLALLLIGLVEFGLILYAHVQVSNAAREAARAASLYRVTRYTAADSAKCSGSIKGWSLNQTVQQAIVYWGLDNNKCPDSTKPMQYTSLGWLDPQPSPLWTASITDLAAQPDDDVWPNAGTRATVQLKYPYRLMILSNLLPFLSDPIMITKSVQFEFQQ